MNPKLSSLITALVLAVLLFQFAPIGGMESASAASLCNAVTFISDVTTPDGSIRKRILVEPVGRVFVERSSDAGATWFRE